MTCPTLISGKLVRKAGTLTGKPGRIKRLSLTERQLHQTSKALCCNFALLLQTCSKNYSLAKKKT